MTWSNSRWMRRGRSRTWRHANAGFTLVEMLVVITIIGLIMALVAPRVLNYLGEAKSKAAKIQIASFGSALDLFYLDLGRYPSTSEGLAVLAQPHCHHHAVMGYTADRALLDQAGATFETVGGCCGLAGNFGVEKGHYDVSVAVAEQSLLPAVRSADAATVVLADGFSCRTQLQQLSSRRGIHLAQLLADRLDAKRPSS